MVAARREPNTTAECAKRSPMKVALGVRYALAGLRCYGLLAAARVIPVDLSEWNHELWFGSNALFVALDSWASLGARRALALLAIVASISFASEQWGVESGAIFGKYTYGAKLGPKLGHVPVTIPISWWVYYYAAHCVVNACAATAAAKARAATHGRASGMSRLPKPALKRTCHNLGLEVSGTKAELIQRIIIDDYWSGRTGTSRVARALGLAAMDAFATTAIDLYVDPVFASNGFWTWLDPVEERPYFGIPLRNFAGWWGTAFVIGALFRLLCPSPPPPSTPPVRSFGGVGIGHTLRAWAPVLPLLFYSSEALFAVGGCALPGVRPPSETFAPAEAATLRLIATFAILPWALLAFLNFLQSKLP